MTHVFLKGDTPILNSLFSSPLREAAFQTSAEEISTHLRVRLHAQGHLQTLHLPRSHLLGTKLPTKCLQLSLPSHSSSSTSSKTHQLRSPDKCPNCCSSPQSPSSTAEARPAHLTFLALEQAARHGLALLSSPTALLQG